MYKSGTPSISGLSTTSRMTSHSVATLATTVQEKTGLSIPILQDAVFTNVQKGSVVAAIYSIFQGLFAIVTGIFDIYVLILATPGQKHTGYYLFSYDFVYSGNLHVRNSLVLFGIMTAIGGVAVIVTSVMLLQGLRKEIETRMEPWIWCMAIFTVWRLLIFIYSTVVNDMVFAYHIVMCIFWMVFVVVNVYAWLVVHSFYHELCEVARLEDVARVKMETMSTFTASRPTTPGARSDVSARMLQ